MQTSENRKLFFSAGHICPVLDDVRHRFSTIAVISIWLMSVLAAFAVTATAAPALPVMLAILLLPAVTATVLWRLKPEAASSRFLLAFVTLIPALLAVYSLSGTPAQFAAILAVAAIMTATVFWTCAISVAIATITAMAGYAIVFALPLHNSAIAVPPGTLIALVLATAVHGGLLSFIVQFARSTAARLENKIKQSAASNLTIEELARQQSSDAGREKERRTKLQKLITEFDTEFLDSLDSVLQSLAAMKTTASGLTEIANRTNTEVLTAARSSEESSESIVKVAVAVEQLSSSISAINVELLSANELAETIDNSAQGTNQAIDSFDESIRRIDDIVSLIQSIASQINLLALNATIEAARAGDAGRGFAVVATEVKSLANQTANATQDVSVQISEIKAAAARAFNSARDLSHGVRDINERTQTISTSVQEQDRATRTIHANMEKVSTTIQGMAQINENVRSSSEGTQHVANEVLESTQSIQGKAVVLETSIHQLLQRIASA